MVAEVNMFPVEKFRDRNEKQLFIFCAIYGVFIWLIVVLGTFGIALLFAPFIAAAVFIMQMYFKAVIYADAVKVSDGQYVRINDIVKSQCAELGIRNVDVFLMSGSGLINAFAMKLMSGKFVILYSTLVDLMLERDEIDELKMVIGHELAHHAAGHTNIFRSLLTYPAKSFPFLGAAYSRACEHTCDRIGAELAGDLSKAKRALAGITAGSVSLADEINFDALMKQDAEAPQFFIAIREIFSTHPRLAERIRYLDRNCPPLAGQAMTNG